MGDEAEGRGLQRSGGGGQGGWTLCSCAVLGGVKAERVMGERERERKGGRGGEGGKGKKEGGREELK